MLAQLIVTWTDARARNDRVDYRLVKRDEGNSGIGYSIERREQDLLGGDRWTKVTECRLVDAMHGAAKEGFPLLTMAVEHLSRTNHELGEQIAKLQACLSIKSNAADDAGINWDRGQL